MAIEEPSYQVVSKNKNYEIRKYGPVIVAETKVQADFESAGKKGFRILAGYIFGGNKTKTKMAMTAPVNQAPVTTNKKTKITTPVTQNKVSQGFVVQFTMPEGYTLETLPAPDDSRVELREIAARTVAVYSYSGSWTEARYQGKLAAFQLALNKNAIKAIGEPMLARFNSPFQLWFLRRNEIWIEIAN